MAINNYLQQSISVSKADPEHSGTEKTGCAAWIFTSLHLPANNNNKKWLWGENGLFWSTWTVGTRYPEASGPLIQVHSEFPEFKVCRVKQHVCKSMSAQTVYSTQFIAIDAKPSHISNHSLIVTTKILNVNYCLFSPWFWKQASLPSNGLFSP